jgi:hypothetical protein
MELQSTEEFKHFCDTYLNVYLMNEEVEYILSKSYEDSEAPFSYDDFEHFYYDKEELKAAIIEDIESNEEKEGLLTNLSYINDDLNQNLKTREELLKDLEDYLKDLDIEELKDIFNSLCLDLEDYEHQTEVMQWFMVCDDRILSELEDRGEVVLNGKFWGRQAYGQSITMDCVMIDIFKEWYLDLYEIPFDLNKEVVTSNEVEKVKE